MTALKHIWFCEKFAAARISFKQKNRCKRRVCSVMCSPLLVHRLFCCAPLFYLTMREADIFYLFLLKTSLKCLGGGVKIRQRHRRWVQRRCEHNQKCARWSFLSGLATATAANRAWGVWVPAPHQLNIWCGRPWLVGVGESQDPEM